MMNFKAVLQHLQKGTSPLIHYHKVVLLRRVCHASRALFFSFFFFVFCLFFFYEEENLLKKMLFALESRQTLRG